MRCRFRCACRLPSNPNQGSKRKQGRRLHVFGPEFLRSLIRAFLLLACSQEPGAEQAVGAAAFVAAAACVFVKAVASAVGASARAVAVSVHLPAFVLAADGPDPVWSGASGVPLLAVIEASVVAVGIAGRVWHCPYSGEQTFPRVEYLWHGQWDLGELSRRWDEQLRCSVDWFPQGDE